MLDLDPRVHLEEVVVPLAVEQPLDRARALVADGARGLHGDGPDPLAQLGRDRRRGRLLDELLVPPLDRAVALAEVNHIAVRICEHLHLDVTRILEIALDVDRRVREVRLSFPPRGLVRALRLARVADDLQSLAATAGRGLDRDRPAELVAEPPDLLGRLDGLRHTGNDRYARRAHPLAGLDLRSHRLDRLGRRADPDEAALPAHPRERGVLGEEPGWTASAPARCAASSTAAWLR